MIQSGRLGKPPGCSGAGRPENNYYIERLMDTAAHQMGVDPAELRKLAAARMNHESQGQTLQPTALVHEAYLRLVGDDNVKWENRAHFFGAAARSIRQILINRAKQKKTEKHGGQHARIELDEALLGGQCPSDQILALDSALEKLESIDERKSQIVMLRYFAGLSEQEAADVLSLSRATASRWWAFARAWLYERMH